MKTLINKLLKKLYWLVITHLGRLLLAVILIVIGGLMSPEGTIGELIYNYDKGYGWHIPLCIGVIILLVETLIMITYAWVINPIRNYKERKKK